MSKGTLWIRGGIAGMIGPACYVAGVQIPWRETQLGVSLAVGAGLDEITSGLDRATATALRRGLRLVDQGLDVAWDLLIGTALIFSGIAMRPRRGLGLAWAIPSAALGIALIVLNAVTFPWPPASRGLIDIGPLIGLFVFALAARLMALGQRANREA